jgi:hypothetical protein
MFQAQSAQSAHPWLARFCLRLMRLQPGLHMVHAVQSAVATYPYATDLAPEQAAEMFAQAHPNYRVTRSSASANDAHDEHARRWYGKRA